MGKSNSCMSAKLNDRLNPFCFVFFLIVFNKLITDADSCSEKNILFDTTPESESLFIVPTSGFSFDHFTFAHRFSFTVFH
jgi:hypothetical protein